MARGIGGSQVASVVGLSPWKPAIQLWQELVEEAPDQRDTPAMKWGRLLEPAVRDEYAVQIGRAVTVAGEPIYHPAAMHRRATVDGLVLNAQGKPEWGVEIKTANSGQYWGPAGTDEIPIYYLAQVAWYQHILGLERWDVAVLIGGSDFRVYMIQRDREFEDALVTAVDEFWTEYVVAKKPPPLDHTREFRHYLERRWPNPRDEYLRADHATDELVATILERTHFIAGLERDNEFDKNMLCAIIGDRYGLESICGRVTWKPQKGRRTVDWEAVARELADRFEFGELELLAQAHTKTAKASRSLRLPRVKDLPRPTRTPEQLKDDNELFRGVVLGPGGTLGPTEEEEGSRR